MRIRDYGMGLALLGLSVWAGAEPIVFYAPHAGIIVRDSDEKTMPGGAPTEVLTTGGITFRLFYTDIINSSGVGFDSPSVGANARARVNDTLTYLADVLHEQGTLDILFNESINDSGSGTLASAGTYYPGANGFFGGSTLARLHDPGDQKPFSNVEEIAVSVNFGKNWNFSSSPAVSPQYDFQSVLLHELTHGLGFASLSDNTGTSRFFSQLSTKTYTIFDTLLRRRTGNVTLFSGSPPTFQVGASNLTSNDLSFAGSEAGQAYQPNPAPGIYAPSIFSQGSSLSHWDTNNIVGGAVMEHAIASGENHRAYSAVDLGALRDIGYLDAQEGVALDCNLANCPNFAMQGSDFYLVLSGLLSQSLDYATTDIDGGGIPDRFEVALLERLLCSNTTSFGNSAVCVFNANRATLSNEGVFSLISAFADIAAALLTISTEIQNSVPGLTGNYEAFTGDAKAMGEVLSPQGDPDADGVSNLEEYQNTIADSGSVNDFVNAALNPLSDGSLANSVPVGGALGLASLLTALGGLGVARARNRK